MPPAAALMTAATGVRARRRGRVRALGWGAAVAAVLVGAAAAAVGVVVQATPESSEPVTLPVGEAVVVPHRVPLSGPMVVYGTPPGAERPELADLGCEVTSGGGPLSTAQARREDRIVVDGTGTVPLVSFPGHEGYGIACSGAAAVAAAPLHLVPGASARDLVPVAGFSAAALLLPLGGTGLLMLRASRA